MSGRRISGEVGRSQSSLTTRHGQEGPDPIVEVLHEDLGSAGLGVRGLLRNTRAERAGFPPAAPAQMKKSPPEK